MENLSVDHLLGIKFLNQNDLELIFETADNFKQIINRPVSYTHLTLPTKG